MAWSKILGLENNFLEKKGEEVNVVYVEKSAKKKSSKKKKNLFSEKATKSTTTNVQSQVPIDLYDDYKNNQLIIKSVLPGISSDEIDINVEPEMIMINYERVHRQEENRKYFYKELPYGSISRTIVLPHQVRPEKARANLKNGILTIILLKTAKEKDKIEVK